MTQRTFQVDFFSGDPPCLARTLYIRVYCIYGRLAPIHTAVRLDAHDVRTTAIGCVRGMSAIEFTNKRITMLRAVE